MIATIGPHPGSPGVWCVFVDDGSGEDHYRILSTHSTRDGAAVSANQVNRAERSWDDYVERTQAQEAIAAYEQRRG